MQAQSKDGIFREVPASPPKTRIKAVRGGCAGYAVLREGAEWGVFLLTIGGTDTNRGLKLLSTWKTESLAEKEAKRLNESSAQDCKACPARRATSALRRAISPALESR